MNTFENLIDELKEENLLEETVTEIKKAEKEAELDGEKLRAAAENLPAETIAETNNEFVVQEEISENAEENVQNERVDSAETADFSAAETEADDSIKTTESLPENNVDASACKSSSIFFRESTASKRKSCRSLTTI